MCRAAQLSEHFRLLNKPFTQCYYFQLCHKLTNSRIIWATLPSGLDKKYRSQSGVKGNILIISLIEWALILSLECWLHGADGWIYVALKRRTQEQENIIIVLGMKCILFWKDVSTNDILCFSLLNMYHDIIFPASYKWWIIMDTPLWFQPLGKC